MRVAVLASGRGSNLQSLLRHIAAGHVDARVTLVASDRADARALDIARKAGVPAVASLAEDASEEALLQMLDDESPDLVVLAGYLRIVGPAILERFPGRIVNVHPSLLPAFTGLKAVRKALRRGVGVAGCTTHIVTGELDGGPILLQAALTVRSGEQESDLSRRVLALEHILLPRTVQLFAEGRITLADGKARIATGDSWLHRKGIDLVAGALYSEGF
jgi:phosphoribosylglycinamide formyltransferase 1